jgi:hypothetical protein
VKAPQIRFQLGLSRQPHVILGGRLLSFGDTVVRGRCGRSSRLPPSWLDRPPDFRSDPDLGSSLHPTMQFTFRCRRCPRKPCPAGLASLGALPTASWRNPLAFEGARVSDSAESSARHLCASPAMDETVSRGLLIKICH